MLSKIEILKSKILADMKAGRLKKGDPLPSRNQYMRRFGCARGSIDAAMASLIQSGHLYARRGSGTFVAEVTRPAEVRTVFVLQTMSPSHHGVYRPNTASLIVDKLQNKVRCQLYSQTESAAHCEKMMMPGSVVIWLRPPYEHLALMRQLDNAGTPQLLVGRSYAHFSHVSTDPTPAIRKGLEWLIAEGGRDLCYITTFNDSDRPYIAERQIAFYESCLELGITPDMNHVYKRAFDNVSRDINEVGAMIFKTGSAHRAIFLAEIVAAPAFMTYARAVGKEPGRDFHLLIFDEAPGFREEEGIAMLRQRWFEMEQFCIHWVASGECMARKKTVKWVEPELIIGAKNHE